MVGVGISVEMDVGIPVGMETSPEHEESINPHAARTRVKLRFTKMVSFIVPKSGRIVAQGVVQSNRILHSACFLFILLRIT
jgi:hypothetical protein